MKRALAVTVWLTALSCGYRITSAGAGFPQGIHKVFAPIIVNRTTDPGVDTSEGRGARVASRASSSR